MAVTVAERKSEVQVLTEEKSAQPRDITINEVMLAQQVLPNIKYACSMILPRGNSAHRLPELGLNLAVGKARFAFNGRRVGPDWTHLMEEGFSAFLPFGAVFAPQCVSFSSRRIGVDIAVFLGVVSG